MDKKVKLRIDLTFKVFFKDSDFEGCSKTALISSFAFH